MTATLHLLDWDTERLRIKTAKIHTNIDNLPDILSQAKSQQIKLVYWQTPNLENYLHAAEKYHGILTDRKITYLIDLTQLNPSELEQSLTQSTERYTEQTASPALLHLAYESGNYSRFRADPHLSEQQFQAIYQEWINNSVNHSIAKEVLVIRNLENELLGMATLGEKNNRGDIGLLAVSEKARGQHVGTNLVKSAQHYFLTQQYTHSQVVTQETNIPACRLYEKCGYHKETTEFFFHFWL